MNLIHTLSDQAFGPKFSKKFEQIKKVKFVNQREFIDHEQNIWTGAFVTEKTGKAAHQKVILIVGHLRILLEAPSKKQIKIF